VLLGSKELSYDEYTTLAWIHVAFLPAGLVLVGGMLWYLSARDARSAASRSSAEPDDLVEAPA
jgi:hypothetical protein